MFESIFRSRCRHSCSLRFCGGHVADNKHFGYYFEFIAHTDTEKYDFRIISSNGNILGGFPCVIVRSGKLQNESFPNVSNFRPEFCPEFCSEFSPNFSRSFRASLRGRRIPEKIHQKSPPFFNAKFPGKHGKNIHKILLESRQSK